MAQAKNSANRTNGSRAHAGKIGGDLKQIFMTMGCYDIVSVLEMPNDEAAVEYALKETTNGAIRIKTPRTFDETSYRKIVRSL